MPLRIGTSIRRALRQPASPAPDALHFHVGYDGRPFVCDIATCESPALTLHDVQTQRTAGGSR